MAENAMHLTDQTTPSEPESLRFEQRRAKRHQINGRATAVSKTRIPEGQQSRIRSLQLVNISDGGVGAICQDSFEIGSSIAIFLPPHGAEQGMDVHGEIVRCIRRDYGHEIGIKIAARLAA